MTRRTAFACSLALAGMFAALTLVACPVAAQEAPDLTWAPGLAVVQAAMELLPAAEAAAQGGIGLLSETWVPGDQQDVARQPSVLFAQVPAGSAFGTGRAFQGGKSYVLVGAADSGATEVAVSVTGADGEALATISAAGGAATLEFTPAEDGMYGIAVVPTSDDGSVCGLAVLGEGGAVVDEEAIGAALSVILIASQAASEAAGPFEWHTGEAEWCLAGGWIEPGQELETLDSALPEARQLIVAGASPNATSIDVVLTDDAGNVVDQDADEGVDAVIEHDGAMASGCVIVRNVASDGPAFVAAGVVVTQ